jgi:hypothetical protein
MIERSIGAVIRALAPGSRNPMAAIANLKAESRISSEEMARRHKALARADAHNRIEGIMPDPATDAIFQAHVRGEIDLEEVSRRIRALHGPR